MRHECGLCHARVGEHYKLCYDCRHSSKGTCKNCDNKTGLNYDYCFKCNREWYTNGKQRCLKDECLNFTTNDFCDDCQIETIEVDVKAEVDNEVLVEGVTTRNVVKAEMDNEVLDKFGTNTVGTGVTDTEVTDKVLSKDIIVETNIGTNGKSGSKVENTVEVEHQV